MTPAVPHGEIARQTLRAGRRSLITWSVAFAAIIALYAVIWPSVRGNTRWRELFNTLPETYRALFTAGGQIDLSTPAGYLGVELLGFLGPALIAVYAITVGAAALAGEEADGRLEITLSAPVGRWRLLAERFAALVADVVAVMLAMGLVLWAFSATFGMGLTPAAIGAATAALAIFGVFAGAVAIAVGAGFGGPALARGIAALAAVLSYLMNALAQVTSVLRGIRPASPFYLLFGNQPLAHGLRVGPALAVIAVSFALVALGGLGFARRDLR